MSFVARREQPDPVQVRADLEAELARHPRLSIPDVVRIPAGAAASFSVGMIMGLAHGSKTSGLRFRAEHAHKLPQTTTGWFLYHKSKNYHVAYGGIREGLRMGAKVSLWTTAMLAVENMFDHYRGTVDAANTVLACVATAGGLSLWSRSRSYPIISKETWLIARSTDQFPLIMAARTTKTALVVGLVYGGVQDVVGLARGRRVRYVEYARQRLGGVEKHTSKIQPPH